MLGTIAALVGFGVAAKARSVARKGLFRTLLKDGLIKGVARSEAKVALKGGGEALFANLYKKNRNQIATFAKNAAKGGDKFLLAQSKYVGRGRGAALTGYMRDKAAQRYALGLHKYNTLGGIGGVAAGIGMLGIGTSVGSGAAGMMNEVPLPSQEMQNANMFIMPRRAHTQRQRALQAISMTQLSLRSAFGQEAAYMHR